MQDIDTNRSAIHDMVAAAAVAAGTGAAFAGLDIRPYRRSTCVRALASFTGPSDRDTVEEVSYEIGERIAAGFGASWAFADRIEFDRTRTGFQLTIGFDTAPATVN